jgi:hypothetical protein
MLAWLVGAELASALGGGVAWFDAKKGTAPVPALAEATPNPARAPGVNSPTLTGVLDGHYVGPRHENVVGFPGSTLVP